MHQYCIVFMRQTDDDNTEHRFFAYAETKERAMQRFCDMTGYTKACVISIYVKIDIESKKGITYGTFGQYKK